MTVAILVQGKEALALVSLSHGSEALVLNSDCEYHLWTLAWSIFTHFKEDYLNKFQNNFIQHHEGCGSDDRDR